ncbi:MAG: DUF563 domain-containing protein, partial [Selenomonadaceae bacterium]|nr:DUF563 domain-containing protein [Selenomonadaceae bacterium]
MSADNYNAQNLEYALRHRLFTGNRDKWHDHVTRKYLLDLQLKVAVVEQGILLPPIRFEANGSFYGGVFDRNFRFVGGYLRKTDPTYRDGSTVSVAYAPKDVIVLQEEVIFGGMMMGHFGHFILECLNRYWYFIKNPQDKRRVVFVVHWGVMWHGLTDWIKAFLQFVDIDESRILIIDRPTMFKKIIVPDQSLYLNDGYCKEYVSIYDHIIKRAQQSVIETLSSDQSVAESLSATASVD